jgi:hypothetical protein
MPENMIDWLLEDRNIKNDKDIKQTTNKKTNKKLNTEDIKNYRTNKIEVRDRRFDITDEKIWDVLN